MLKKNAKNKKNLHGQSKKWKKFVLPMQKFKRFALQIQKLKKTCIVNAINNKNEKPFSPYGCARSDNSFRSDFKNVINIQFDIKTTIPNLTKLWQFDATYTGLNQF